MDINIYLSVHACMCLYVCMCVCVYVSVCVSVCVCTNGSERRWCWCICQLVWIWHKVVNDVVPIRPCSRVNTSHHIGDSAAGKRVILKIVAPSVKTNDSIACPIEIPTQEREHCVGLSAIGDDQSLVCIVLKYENTILT